MDHGTAERRLTAFSTYSPDVLCETRDGVVTFVTPNSENITGLTPSAFIGRNMSELIHTDDWPGVASFMEPGWVGEFEATIRVMGARGGWHWREVHGRRELEADGSHCAAFVLRDISERRSHQEAIAVSETRAKAVLAAIPDLMFRLARDGRYLDFKAERTTDLYTRPEEIVGSYANELLPPDLAAQVMDYIARALDEGGVHTLEYHLPRNGQMREHEARFTACGDDEVVVISRDITERKRIELELVQSEQKYRSLVEGARDIVYTMDLEGNFTSANAVASNVFGYSTDEILSMNISQIVDPKHIAYLIENAAFSIRGERVGEPVEFLTYAKDGSQRWMEVVATPIWLDGSIVGFQGIARDIGERKRAEERIHFQAELLDAIHQAVFVVDASGTIIFWNKFSEELYGLSKSETIGRSITTFEPSQDRRDALEAYERLLKGEQWTGELLANTQDGRSFPVLIAVGPIADAEGSHIGVACVTAEITSLKKAQQEAVTAHEQASLAEERARIAQELHDNVAQYFFGIGIAAKELAERENSSTALLKRRLAHIRRLSADGGREIRRAIDALVPQTSPVDIKTALAPDLEELRASGLDVRFTQRHDGPPPDEQTRALLQATARELLFNVRKHASATSVRVRLLASADSVSLTVVDNGVGRAADVESEIVRGTGFGLRSVRHRIEQQGGTLSISDTKGGGLRFVCKLSRQRLTAK